jgi:hypothetical protein
MMVGTSTVEMVEHIEAGRMEVVVVGVVYERAWLKVLGIDYDRPCLILLPSLSCLSQ